MAGRLPSSAPEVPVADTAVGAVVPSRRAIVNSWVPVDPVVKGAVEVVVVQPRAISHTWERVFLVGGVRPALAVEAVCLEIGPADGDRGCIAPLDDASFTTEIAIHSGAGVPAPFVCVELLDSGSPQTFIRRHVWDCMLSASAASIGCEQKYAPYVSLS